MTVEAFIDAMPKAELHIHLEGSVQPTTLLELADKNGVKLPVCDEEGVRQWYTFRNFDHFVEIYIQISRCLQTPDDFSRITYEYGRSMAKQNIRYAEVTWTPYSHVCQGIAFQDLLDGINAGRAQAKREWGVDMQWIPDIGRSQVSSQHEVVEWISSPTALDGGVVALGLGGPEVGYPPELFETAFQSARANGLHSNPHAGETVGPDSVWGALKTLKAERIGHGVRSVEDPALLAHLVKHQIALEVNLTSNLCLGVYPSYADHPLPRLLAEGVSITINSDDPPLFNTTLSDEYGHAVKDCGLSIDQLEQIALNALRVSYLSEPAKNVLISEFEAAYRMLRIEHELPAHA